MLLCFNWDISPSRMLDSFCIKRYYAWYTVFFKIDQVLNSQEVDKRTTSVCESIASTVTATSDVEDMSSGMEDNDEDNDSDTTSAPSPTPQRIEEGKIGPDLWDNCKALLQKTTCNKQYWFYIVLM